MAIPFADILQDQDLPVRSVGMYTHINNIIIYDPSEHIRTERVKFPRLSLEGDGFPSIAFLDPYYVQEAILYPMIPSGRGMVTHLESMEIQLAEIFIQQCFETSCKT
jgi:hypothetical protein